MDNEMVTAPKDFFRSVNTLFFALVAGQILFGLCTSVLVINKMIPNKLDQKILDIAIWLIPALAISGVLMSWAFFSARLKVLREKETLNEKLNGYRSALLIRWAMMEGPSLLALITFYMSGNFIFLGVAAFIVVVYLFNRPAKTTIIQQLQLHDDELMQLEDDNFRP